jgi:UMF1 family MFS transporter
MLAVVSGFFPFFFKSYYGAGAGAVETTFRLGAGNTAAGVIIAALSLALGAAAGGRKKRFLFCFMMAGSLATAALFFVARGDWVAALALFILGNVGFSCANLFYDALLVDVSDKKNMDLISSMGFSFGYVGGAILFVFCAWMAANPARLGFADSYISVRVSFLCVAAWWMVFSAPLLAYVKERTRAPSSRPKNPFATIKKTFLSIIKNPALVLFLCAYWLYFDGVNTFIRMAVDFGLSIGLGQGALMTALIVAQVVAFPSALAFGLLSARAGAGRMIMAGVVIYILISSFGAAFMRAEAHFIALAAATGLAQGGIQALSRSYFGKLIPPDESAEYFSFYNIVSRFAVAGPAVVGSVAVASRAMGAHDALASRIGMSSVNIFFISGLALLILAERAGKRLRNI